jgi:hypothetical protein
VLDRQDYERYLNTLTPEEKELLNAQTNYYEITFQNKGGLVMPIILQFEFVDGTTELVRIPAEIWKITSDEVTKIFPLEKEIRQITLDPFLETADVDTDNNYYPPRPEGPSRFELYRSKMMQRQRENPMQRAQRAKSAERGSN